MSGARDLIKLAGRLEALGLEREAGVLRAVFRKFAADGEYDSTATFDPSTTGTARTPEEQVKKERYADYKGLLPTARRIYVPQNHQGDEDSFKESFIGGWKAYPNNPVTKDEWASWEVSKERWNSWAEGIADILWDEKQRAAAPSITPDPKPSSEPAPTSKAPMNDDQKWSAYAKRVPGGEVVKAMWVGSNGAGMALTGDASFESFRKWMPTMMSATGMSSISATQLAGKLSDFKAAALADKANNRTLGGQGSVLGALYAALKSNNTSEYSRIVDQLGAARRVRSE